MEEKIDQKYLVCYHGSASQLGLGLNPQPLASQPSSPDDSATEAGPGPFPGLIDMFGTTGGLLEFRAALLASHGFVTYALPYFYYDDLPKYMMDLDLEYFLEAVDWLESHPSVLPGGLGVIGSSKGGDIALMLAAYCSKVTTIVSINGMTFNSMVPMKYKEFEGGVIPAIEMQMEKMKNYGDLWSTRDSLEYTAADLTPVWNRDAKVLNIVSEDDGVTPGECVQLMKDCFPPEKTDNFVVVQYPEAGHLVEPPYTPHCHHSYLRPFFNYCLWGGKPEPHAYAQEDCWRRILDHFRTYLPKSKPSSKL